MAVLEKGGRVTMARNRHAAADSAAKTAITSAAVRRAIERFRRQVRTLEDRPNFTNAHAACLASRNAWWTFFDHIPVSGDLAVDELTTLLHLMHACQSGVQAASNRVNGRHAMLLIHYEAAIDFRGRMLELLLRDGINEVAAAMLERMDSNVLKTLAIVGTR